MSPIYGDMVNTQQVLGVCLDLYRADSDSGVNKKKREKRGTPSKILVMDIIEDIREEVTMIGNIKTTENKKGVIQQKQKIQINIKVKKYLNHRWINLIQKI